MTPTFARSGRHPLGVEVCPICQEAIAGGNSVGVPVGGILIADRRSPEGRLWAHEACARQLRDIVDYLRRPPPKFEPNLLRRVRRAIMKARTS